MMILPICTMTMAYLLYDRLNRKQLWTASDLSLFEDACFVMSRAFWVIRIIMSTVGQSDPFKKKNCI